MLDIKKNIFIFVFYLAAAFIISFVVLVIFSKALQKNRSFVNISKNSPLCAENAVCKDCNVILLSVDSLRADHIGAYGYKRDTTPNFDKLAQSGALFLNYFSTSFLTPVSEMSVHTGLYPSAHGVTNFNATLPDNIETLAQLFKNQGYKTSALLSSPEPVFNPSLRESFSRGFDQYEDNYNDNGDSNIDNNESVRMYPPLTNLMFSGKFFQWIAVGGVHWPYGQSWTRDVYSDKNYNGIFKKFRDDNNGLNWEIFKNIYDGKLYPQSAKISEKDIQYVVDLYDNGVRAFDDFLGGLINDLKNKDLLDDTVIIIQSEHGEALHENGYIAHYDVMDNQTHVPLLILSPCIKSGSSISSMAGSVDIFPTIASLVGSALPAQVQGKSLLPIINGQEKDGLRQESYIERNPLWEETIAGGIYLGDILKERGIDIGEERHKDIAIRTSKWKYIWRMSKEQMEKISWWQIATGKKLDFPEAELYDIENDPLETRNVIDRYPNEAADLRKRLESWQAEISKKSPERVETKPVIQPYF